MARKPTYEELEQRVKRIMHYTPNILIVDDDPRFCDSLKVLLGNQGYQMQTSNSGREAMEYLVKNNFDLALLDMVMPEMNGHQIMDYINSKSPETLVIVITGHASMESAIESLRRGAYDYLRKPFEPEELLKTVENALNKKRLEKEKKTIQTKFRHLATVEDIQKIVCKYFKIHLVALKSKSRKKIISYPRCIAIYLCRRYTDKSVEFIGRSFKRNHSTILYDYEKTKKNIRIDGSIRREVEFLCRQIEDRIA